MLVFAHHAERPPESSAEDPHPRAQMEQEAMQILGDELPAYQPMSEDSSAGVPAGSELTFVPKVPGIVFNPSSRSFQWTESVHREEFRLQAATELDGETTRGQLHVYLGPILLAEMNLTLRIDSAKQPEMGVSLAVDETRPYRKIFASYSRQDIEIVEHCERVARLLGDRYLRDATSLRAGEVWSERLKEMIEDADVFQLFWSWNSIESDFVQQEWRHALSLGRSNFVRPSYWEDPLPRLPEHDLPPQELERLNFERLEFGDEDVRTLPVDLSTANPALMQSAPPRRRGRALQGLTGGTIAALLLLVIGGSGYLHLKSRLAPERVSESAVFQSKAPTEKADSGQSVEIARDAPPRFAPPPPAADTAPTVRDPEPAQRPWSPTGAEQDYPASADASPPSPLPVPAYRPVQRGDMVRMGPGVEPPRLLRRPSPQFPAMALELDKEETRVHLRVLVDESGQVIEAEIVGEEQGFGFDQAATSVAMRSTYEPATKDGVPVKVWHELVVEFRRL